MEKVTGIITCLAQRKSGVSASTGNQWVVQTVVVARDGITNEWEKYYCFDVFGEENISRFQVGQHIEVNVSVYATESNGSWYNRHKYLPPRQESAPTPQPQVQSPQPTTQVPPMAQPHPNATYAQPYVQPQPQSVQMPNNVRMDDSALPF